ncbi:MAG TPA: hypothetical protein VKA36_06845 [Solirubrobacterales bacterium]|nr:hypothetical protein [Solirubrobacterales bacterium]
MDPDRQIPPDAPDPRSTSRVQVLNPEVAGLGTCDDLHICPRCNSHLVQPVEWAPVDTHRWRIELHCPECEWESAGLYPQHVLDRYDAVLDDGAAALIENLTRLERSNIEEGISRFVGAISADQILPEDF